MIERLRAAKSAHLAPAVPGRAGAWQRDEAAALDAALRAAAGREPELAVGLLGERREMLVPNAAPGWTSQLALELATAVENALVPAKRERERWPRDAKEQAALRLRIAASDETAGTRASAVGRACRRPLPPRRRLLPSYRDWGAFVLIGGLPERYEARSEA